MRYAADHWHGRLGLGRSFWINLVLLRIVVFALQEWLAPENGGDYSTRPVLVLSLALVFHGLLFVWQAVGVLRATEVYMRAGGPMAPVWGAQLVTAAAFFWVLSYAFGAWQMTLPVPDDLKIQTDLEAARAAKYSIRPAADGRSLTLTGSLELGISRRLTEQLAAYPDARQIVLTSTGGNIFEARGLSSIIRQHRLNTLVVAECSSACTTVFIGGQRREIAPGGRLGFHRYRIDAGYAVLNADPAGQQDLDRALFLRSGVADWFLERMFDSAASEMWFPTMSELIDAHVITGFGGPGTEY